MAATTKTKRQFWDSWCHFLHIFFPGTLPNLSTTSPPEQIAILGAFASYIRAGHHKGSKREQVSAETVQVALRAISTTLQLAGQPNPLVGAQGKYPKAITQQLEGYKRSDPPSRPQLAAPLHLIQFILAQLSASPRPRDQALADSLVIAFYFLLRVGEYTYSNPTAKKRTHPITASDVTLWCNGTVLHPALPLNLLLHSCTQASITIRNQKSGKQQAILSHHATRKPDCPITAIVRRLHHIHSNTSEPDNTIISTYFSYPNRPYTLNPTTINTAIRYYANLLRLPNSGFPLERLSSHSLRAGGAMALHQAGVQEYVIKKLGRWSTDTFMTYIHAQLSSFSSNLAMAMSTQQPFHNLAGAQQPPLHIQALQD